MPKRIRQTFSDHKAGFIRKRPTVCTDILASSLLEHENSVDRLAGEASSIIGAGTETTAWTLSIITFYLLSQPKTQTGLAEELKAVDLENVSWVELEKLPYLSAVIAEEGTAIGMPSAITHHDEDVCPNSATQDHDFDRRDTEQKAVVFQGFRARKISTARSGIRVDSAHEDC
ncbi:heme binding [Ascochyta rabiei]|uniref:Heme binding n=1 Tax=Didymella rabiei TaxID=5454 RepID=A0A163KVL5_DIDRA|nr:heme binding [Ascochyta rabiei]